MSQPPFQPPPQPQPQPPQPAQPPQSPSGPYNQPAPPQHAPGFGPPTAPGHSPMQPGPPPVPGQPAMQAGLPPVPGQAPVYGGPPSVPGGPLARPPYPMQPGPPFQAPSFGQQAHTTGDTGNPVGAVLLGFFVSVVVSLLYTGLILATYKDQSLTTANTLYLAHALLNGAIVGLLVGLMAHRSNGARIGGAVIAALGAFFGYTNALPLIIVMNQTPKFLMGVLEADPFFPAKDWWTSEAHGGVDWVSPLGLVVAAAAAWGLAYVVGSRRRRI